MKNHFINYDDIILKECEFIISEIEHDPEMHDTIVREIILVLSSELCSNVEDSLNIIKQLSNEEFVHVTEDETIKFARYLIEITAYEEVKSLIKLKYKVEYDDIIGTFNKCEHCGTVFSVLLVDRFPFDIETPSGKALCNDCITSYSICDKCDEYYLKSTSPLEDICGSCAWDIVNDLIDDESKLRTYESTM